MLISVPKAAAPTGLVAIPKPKFIRFKVDPLDDAGLTTYDPWFKEFVLFRYTSLANANNNVNAFEAGRFPDVKFDDTDELVRGPQWYRIAYVDDYGHLSELSAVVATNYRGTISDDIDDGAITRGKVLDGEIITSKLANAAVDVNKLAQGAVTLSKFASGLTGVEIVATLPNSGNFTGRTVVLTTDGKLYRYNGTTWTAAVAAADMSGQLTSEQIAELDATKLIGTIASARIANASLTAAKLAADVGIVERFATLPTTGNFAGRMVFNTTDKKLYRHNGTTFTAAVDAADMSGALTSDQIADLDATKLTGTIAAARIAQGTIDATKLASTIKPIEVVATKPADNTATPQGRVIFVTGENKLYRATGSAWVALINAADMSGQLTNAQIAALDASKLTGTIVEARLASLDASKLTGTINEARIAALNASKLTGSIQSTQIADDSITTPKLATGAVTANEIAANTITAGQIAANAITTDELAANAVQAYNILAGAITTDKMTANTINGDRIAANTLNASKIVAGSITTDRMTANSIDGDRIAANTLDANKIVANSITAGQMAAGAIGADQIAANSISAGKLTVAAISDNLIIDGNFESGLTDAWVRGGGNAMYVQNDAGSISGGKALVLDRGTTTVGQNSMNATYTDYLPVVPGQEYYASFDIRGDTASGAGAYLRMLYYDANKQAVTVGSVTYTDIYGNGALTTAFVTRSGLRTIPAGVKYIRMQIYHHNTSTTRYMLVSNVTLRRRIGGELIVDGAITTDHMTANTINGDRITANTLNASKITAGTITTDRMTANTINGDRIAANTLHANKIQANTITAGQIAAGTITGDEIAANAITAKQLLLTDFSNIADNGWSQGNRDGWTISGLQNWYQDLGANSGQSGWYLQSNGRDQAGSAWISVNPGDVFFFDVWVYNTDTSNVNVFLHTTTPNAGANGWNPAAFTALKNQWVHLVGQATVPAGHTRARMLLQTDRVSGQGTSTYWSRPIMRRANGAELIVDGAITTDKMTANSINGDRITANTLNASKIIAGTITTDRMTANTINGDRIAGNTLHGDKIIANSITAGRIAAGAITTDELGAGAVTAAKMAVGASKNFIVNSDFLAGTTGWGYRWSTQPASFNVSIRTDTYSAGGAALEILQTNGNQGVYYDYAAMSPLGGYAEYTVEAGEWYELSVYYHGHRCNGVRPYIIFRDINGTDISSPNGGIWPANQLINPGGKLSAWQRNWFKAQAPANAVKAYVFFRHEGTMSGQVNSYLWLKRPYFGKCIHANQSEPSEWSEGGMTLISGGNIVTNAITSSHINVANLAAISATLGNVDISNANIGTLSVDTINIAGNAVTIQSGSFTAGAVQISASGWTFIQSTALSWGASASLYVFCQFRCPDNVPLDLEIRSGATVIESSSFRAPADVTMQFMGLYQSGVVSGQGISFWLRKGENGLTNIFNRKLIALATKR